MDSRDLSGRVLDEILTPDTDTDNGKTSDGVRSGEKSLASVDRRWVSMIRGGSTGGEAGATRADIDEGDDEEVAMDKLGSGCLKTSISRSNSLNLSSVNWNEFVGVESTCVGGNATAARGGNDSS